MKRLVLLGVAACALGCPSTPTADDATTAIDAGLDASATDDAFFAERPDARPDASLPAPTEEPYKGPWVMRPTTSRVVVRWETRLPLMTPTVIFTEETMPGPERRATGTSTRTEVQLTHGIGVRGITDPDVPGTYYVNEVNVTGLSPATCYTYEVDGFPDALGRFCTAHAPSDVTTPINFYAIGDTSPFFMGTVRVLNAVPPSESEFSIHVGDIQYYSTIFETQQYWFRTMQPLLRANAFLPCLGNHEDEIDHELTDIYDRLFATPGDESDSTYWYHYESGGVHFLSVSSEHDLSLGSPQSDWLLATLARIEAEPGYRFSVLYLHRPFYSVGDYGIRADQRDTMEPIVRAHRIPLVLAGHMHAYERFRVPYGTGPDAFEVSYVTTGAGGFRIPEAALSMNAAAHPIDASYRVAAGAYIQATRFVITREAGEDVIRGTCADDMGMEQDAFAIRCTPVPGAGPRCTVR
jgi:hypothetical protein